MNTERIAQGSIAEPVISLRDLRVSYGDREILHGINLDVLPGETLVILGGSGSGKSTLLRTLVGLEKPSSGEILIKGRDLAKDSALEMDEIRRKMGMSFQGGALFGSMTVGENVALSLREHTQLEDSTIEIIAAQRWNEKTRSRGARAGDGPGNPAFRRALGRTGPDHRGWHRSVDSSTQACLSHDHHRGHARIGERILDRGSHALN